MSKFDKAMKHMISLGAIDILPNLSGLLIIDQLGNLTNDNLVSVNDMLEIVSGGCRTERCLHEIKKAKAEFETAHGIARARGFKDERSVKDLIKCMGAMHFWSLMLARSTAAELGDYAEQMMNKPPQAL